MCLNVNQKETEEFRATHSGKIKVHKILTARYSYITEKDNKPKIHTSNKILVTTPYRMIPIENGGLFEARGKLSHDAIDEGAIHCLLNPDLEKFNNFKDSYYYKIFHQDVKDYMIEVEADMEDFIAVGLTDEGWPSICFKKITIPQAELDKILDLANNNLRK